MTQITKTYHVHMSCERKERFIVEVQAINEAFARLEAQMRVCTMEEYTGKHCFVIEIEELV